jgi:hypothetical protein
MLAGCFREQVYPTSATARNRRDAAGGNGLEQKGVRPVICSTGGTPSASTGRGATVCSGDGGYPHPSSVGRFGGDTAVAAALGLEPSAFSRWLVDDGRPQSAKDGGTCAMRHRLAEVPILRSCVPSPRPMPPYDRSPWPAGFGVQLSPDARCPQGGTRVRVGRPKGLARSWPRIRGWCGMLDV